MERETEHEQGRGRERGRHRIQSRLQVLSCRHRARRGARTHEPRDHDLSRSRTLNRLSHPGAPGFLTLMNNFAVNNLIYVDGCKLVHISVRRTARQELLSDETCLSSALRDSASFPKWLHQCVFPPLPHILSASWYCQILRY